MNHPAGSTAWIQARWDTAYGIAARSHGCWVRRGPGDSRQNGYLDLQPSTWRPAGNSGRPGSTPHDPRRGPGAAVAVLRIPALLYSQAVATPKTDREKAQRTIAENRKARHDYHILETWEAGVALLGTEVKSIREGRVNLRDSFARVENGEVWMLNVHISPYNHRGSANHEELRQRKLLLHRDEIRKMVGKVAEKGLTLVPLELYFKNGRVKVLLGLARGKQAHDKRETIRRREVERETRAAVKARTR
jgi:SsrA-binding protein